MTSFLSIFATVSENNNEETIMKLFNSQWEPTDSVSGFFFRLIRDVHTRLCAILRVVQQSQYHQTTTMRGYHGNYVPTETMTQRQKRTLHKFQHVPVRGPDLQAARTVAGNKFYMRVFCSFHHIKKALRSNFSHPIIKSNPVQLFHM
jgi:hypothetical protein